MVNRRGDQPCAQLKLKIIEHLDFGLTNSPIFLALQALSDLFKSITSLPSDITMISLDAGPLLELICVAAQKQLTATWLSLAAILIAQLNPPSYSLLTKAKPMSGAKMVVANVLPVFLQCGLAALAVPGAMEAVRGPIFFWCFYLWH